MALHWPTGGALPRPEWDSRIPTSADSISIRNIQTSVYASFDAWGRKKAQPALISATVWLSSPFGSAAEGDVLTSGTLNYGTLSKNILARVDSASTERWMNLQDLAAAVADEIAQTAPCRDILLAVQLQVLLPKALLLGDGIATTFSVNYGSGSMAWLSQLKDIRVAAVIGLNPHEREAKQPVVANLWIDGLEPALLDFHRIGELIAQSIEGSAYQTLEALAYHVLRDLGEEYFGKNDHISDHHSIKLRLEKPMAVPLAEAPAVECSRYLNEIAKTRH